MAVVDRNGPIANAWTRLADDAAVPGGASVVVSLARLKNEHNSLFSTAAAVGVDAPLDVNLDELASFLPRLGLVVLRMTTMRDGRLFSIGRMLRERYGFRGEIRAVGDVLLDQMQMMERCGFDAFEDARVKFDVRYYLVAILFILFDLEIAFLFPWAVSLKEIGPAGFWAMMVFLGILVVGFIYEWKKGALDWE